jgi:flagellar motility protein MotE (MotC chaperone)
MSKRLWQPRFFLVTLIGVALAVLGVRLETLVQSVFSGTPPATIASATAEDAPPKTTDKTTDKPAEAASGAAVAKDEVKKIGDKVEKTEAAAAHSQEKSAEAHDDKTADDKPTTHAMPPEDLSAGEMEVLKQLSSRRTLLDQREQEIQQKSALLQAAELRVEQKVKELETLRAQLQTMLGQREEAQQTQIDTLVKIYEVMKPKEAARILQTLDLPVLLGVMRQMKPAKSAPILAEMESVKAKDITMTLARQHDLSESKTAN